METSFTRPCASTRSLSVSLSKGESGGGIAILKQGDSEGIEVFKGDRSFCPKTMRIRRSTMDMPESATALRKNVKLISSDSYFTG